MDPRAENEGARSADRARRPAYASAHATPTAPATATAVGPPRRSATTPPANAASAPAAARPMPMNPTTRPTRRAGYIAPQRRRWNGPPNERLIQKTKDTAIMTGAIGRTNTSRSEAAPTPRTTASWTDERGPMRPANALRRFATNGAAASAERPSGSSPPRRAIVGRSAVTRPIETPTPTAATRSSARLRPSARRFGDGLNADDRNTTYLEAALLACEVSCRARRGSA